MILKSGPTIFFLKKIVDKIEKYPYIIVEVYPKTFRRDFKIMNDSDIQKVSYAADPRRCQASMSNSAQCMNVAVEGGTVCLVHGGNRQIASIENQSIYKFRVAQWRNRIGEFQEISNIKSLREEIGVLRLLLEELVNNCRTDLDLILRASAISDMVMKIERVVLSCNKLEASMGQHLDKAALMQFASQIVEVITNRLDDTEIVNAIAIDILELMKGDL